MTSPVPSSELRAARSPTRAGDAWAALEALLAWRAEGGAVPTAFELLHAPDGCWSLRRELRPEALEEPRLIVRTGPAASAPPRGFGPGAALYDHAAFLAGGEPLEPARGLPAAELTFLRLYLPALLGGWLAQKSERAFVLGHLAQSLDGRIACGNGHSQWISNEANLHHAHRLRALHTAVAVGGRTVERDNPRLTVRHVSGHDPRRVLISGSGAVFKQPDAHVFQGPGCLVLTRAGSTAGRSLPAGAEVIELTDSADSGPLDGLALARALRSSGLPSVFLEGGGATLSNFLDGGAIDLLHVHVTPIVLGSGVSGFSLPEVERVGDAPRFRMRTFAQGGEVLIECRRVPAEA